MPGTIDTGTGHGKNTETVNLSSRHHLYQGIDKVGNIMSLLAFLNYLSYFCLKLVDGRPIHDICFPNLFFLFRLLFILSSTRVMIMWPVAMGGPMSAPVMLLLSQLPLQHHDPLPLRRIQAGDKDKSGRWKNRPGGRRAT